MVAATVVTNELIAQLLEVWDRQDRLHQQSMSPSATTSVMDRAKAYMAKEDIAVKGQDGSGRCYHVAAILYEGFALKDEGEWTEAIAEWNARCQPPWSASELHHKFESVEAKIKADPSRIGYLLKSPEVNGVHVPVQPSINGVHKPVKAKRIIRVPPYRPFPVDALPEVLRTLVVEGAASISPACDPVYIALPALTAVASIIGATRALQLKRTWNEPAVLWSAIVGDSGTLKSPALSLALDPLFAVQREVREEHEVIYGKGDDAPPCRRLFCSDTTIERLAELIEQSPQGLLMWRDELDGWLQSFKRYKAGGGSDRPQWLELHGCRAIVYDRKTSEGKRTVIVPRAAVSVIGGIQPVILSNAMDSGSMESGLASRLLLAWPPRLPKRWTEDEMPEGVELAYKSLLYRLTKLTFADEADKEKKSNRPLKVRLSREGKATWVKFYNSWAREQASVEGELAAAFSKLEGYCARLVLVLHVVKNVERNCDTSDVSEQTVRDAVCLTHWFAYEARRIYSVLSETLEERNTRRLVEWVRSRNGKATVKELQRSNSRKYPTADSAELALQSLVLADLAKWHESEPRPTGGRSLRWIEITDPTHDVSDDCYESESDFHQEPNSASSDDCSETHSKHESFEQSSETSCVGKKSGVKNDDVIPINEKKQSSEQSSDGGSEGIIEV